MSDLKQWLDDRWTDLLGGYDWMKDLILGEFVEDRPLSVVITDMLASFVPGVVIVTSARDLAAVSLRLGERYAGADGIYRRPAHPEWQEWALLAGCALPLIMPVVGAAAGAVGAGVGALPGAIVGAEAAAFVRAACLLLIRDGKVMLQPVIEFLSRITRGNVIELLGSIRFAGWSTPLVEKIQTFTGSLMGLVRRIRMRAERWPSIRVVQQLLARLETMERQFYAVQQNAINQVPYALAQLDARLAKALSEATTLLPAHVATAGVQAEKPVQAAMAEGRVTAGIGGKPERFGGGPLPDLPPPEPHGPNVHSTDPRTLSNAKKGIFGELVSDQYMSGKGHTNMLPEHRRIRSMDDKPRGRGIDGIYRNANPPPPYIITETKYRTGGEFDAEDLPTTRGSKAYPSAKQGSDDWIRPRLLDALDDERKAKAIRDGRYERWLMVVDENGKVTSITKLDENAKTIGAIQP